MDAVAEANIQLTALSFQFTTNSQLAINSCKLGTESLLNAVNCKLKVGATWTL